MSCDECRHFDDVVDAARRTLGRLMDLHPERDLDDYWARYVDALTDVDLHRRWHKSRSKAAKLAAANRYGHAAQPAMSGHS